MYARLIAEDEPGAWVEFSTRGGRLRARRDPMWLGFEAFSQLLDNPRLFWDLLDETSLVKAMTSAFTSQAFITQFGDYLEACGLSMFKLAIGIRALEDIDLLEVDLLKFGLDVRDWLDRDGELSTRRVVALYLDLLDRPESRIGAKRYSVKPADKAALAVAIFHSGFMEKGAEHDFLQPPESLEEEAEKRRVDAEKRKRMQSDRTQLATPNGPATSSKAESLRMLEKIKAQMGR